MIPNLARQRADTACWCALALLALFAAGAAGADNPIRFRDVTANPGSISSIRMAAATGNTSLKSWHPASLRSTMTTTV